MVAPEINQARHLLKVRMGYEVTTSKGFKWVAVPTGWLDLSTNLTWKYEDEPGKYTFDEATSRFGKSLPTKEEWVEAEAHGVREVLDLEGRLLWSSSLVSNFRYFAWSFYTDFGSVYHNFRSITVGARCVSRET